MASQPEPCVKCRGSGQRNPPSGVKPSAPISRTVVLQLGWPSYLSSGAAVRGSGRREGQAAWAGQRRFGALSTYRPSQSSCTASIETYRHHVHPRSSQQVWKKAAGCYDTGAANEWRVLNGCRAREGCSGIENESQGTSSTRRSRSAPAAESTPKSEPCASILSLDTRQPGSHSVSTVRSVIAGTWRTWSCGQSHLSLTTCDVTLYCMLADHLHCLGARVAHKAIGLPAAALGPVRLAQRGAAVPGRDVKRYNALSLGDGKR